MSSHKSAYYFDSLHYLAELQMVSAKKWLLSLKKAAEQTNNPELFQFHHQAAVQMFSMIKTTEQLAQEMDKKIDYQKAFDAASWLELKQLRQENYKLKKDLHFSIQNLQNFKMLIEDSRQVDNKNLEVITAYVQQTKELRDFIKQNNLWETYLMTHKKI